jgi:hypothetical protein
MNAKRPVPAAQRRHPECRTSRTASPSHKLKRGEVAEANSCDGAWLSLAAAAHGPTRPDVVVLHGLPPADAALGRVNLLERSDVTISLVVRPDIEIGGEHASNRKQSHECESNQFQF